MRRLHVSSCAPPTRASFVETAPLSAQTPPGPPFEENKVKLLISVRFIRGTEATAGFGVERKGRGQPKSKGVTSGEGRRLDPLTLGQLCARPSGSEVALCCAFPPPTVGLAFCPSRRRRDDLRQQQRKQTTTICHKETQEFMMQMWRRG